jgi:hypothetical protein
MTLSLFLHKKIPKIHVGEKTLGGWASYQSAQNSRVVEVLGLVSFSNRKADDRQQGALSSNDRGPRLLRASAGKQGQLASAGDSSVEGIIACATAKTASQKETRA